MIIYFAFCPNYTTFAVVYETTADEIRTNGVVGAVGHRSIPVLGDGRSPRAIVSGAVPIVSVDDGLFHGADKRSGRFGGLAGRAGGTVLLRDVAGCATGGLAVCHDAMADAPPA